VVEPAPYGTVRPHADRVIICVFVIVTIQL